VGQCAKFACSPIRSSRERTDPSGFTPVSAIPGLSLWSRVVGVAQDAQTKSEIVGEPVIPLADVRRPNARRCKIRRPDGKVVSFQVIENKVDPSVASLARNLLSKDACRAPEADEMVKGRPEVSFVSDPKAFACRAERLART
jgi:hypothetical protein